MDYFVHILILASIYTALSVSLDLLVGQTGLMSIAHAGFYGMGAYVSALLATTVQPPFVATMAAGMLFAWLVSFVVSLPSMRLVDDYFVLATFGFQIIIFSVFNNWMELTRGPLGISGIPQPIIFGWCVDTRMEFLILAASVALIVVFLARRLVSSPFGRILRAIRNDEVVTESHGKDTLSFKVTVFAVSTAMAAAGGALYAHYVTYIDPSSFTVTESILIVAMVIIGGAGSKWGPLVGAVVLVAFPELLRAIGLPHDVAASLRQVFYGCGVAGIVIWRPQGLVGEYAFGREAKTR